MTEFRRASTNVEQLEKLVAEICADATVSGGGDASQTARVLYKDAMAKAEELIPSADKMRRKCDARTELYRLRGEIAAHLPGPPSIEAAQKLAQEHVDADGDNAVSLRPLLKHVQDLEAVATYGAKMVEKVLDLLRRFDTARRTMDTELAPKLAEAVKADTATESLRMVEEAKRLAEAAAEAERQEAEKQRRIVDDLMRKNEEQLAEKQEREANEQQRLDEITEAQRLAELAAQAELEALLRAEQESERKLAEVGPNAACADAVAAMLAAPVVRYREAIEGLRDMLASAASEPQDPRFRLVRVGNESFQHRLGRQPGVWLFLRGVGFQVLTRESLPAGLATSVNLNAGPPAERFLWLQEPNMMSEYEAWGAWHERLKGISDFLHALERLAFQRTAHLGQRGGDVAAHTVISAAEVLQRWEAEGG